MINTFPSSTCSNLRRNSGIGSNLDLMISLMFSASSFGFSSPVISSSSAIPKINAPPSVFANALTLLHQLFGFFTSRDIFLSYSVVSPIRFLIFKHFTHFLKSKGIDCHSPSFYCIESFSEPSICLRVSSSFPTILFCSSIGGTGIISTEIAPRNRFACAVCFFKPFICD